MELPPFALDEIHFTIKGENIPDSINTIDINFLSEFHSYALTLEVKNGKVKEDFVIEKSGTYQIKDSLNPNEVRWFRVIPGWLSVVPPLIAIFLALWIRQVVVSLAAGIYAGSLIYYNYEPLTALLRLADTLIINSLIDRDHMFIIVFTLLIGGVVGVISKNGGTIGLAKQITKLAKTARSGMLSSWLMGLLIFFDDYANSLIIGNMMRPITDKLRISREKLSYIVDSTAAPVASIVIISTWIGYEVGLIGDGLRSIGSVENAYDIFIQSIPYRFYPIAAIFFVFLTSYMRRDFGPMYKAEMRARTTGKVSSSDVEAEELIDTEKMFYHSEKAKWFNGLIPILVILFGTIVSLFYTGIQSIEAQGLSDYSIQNIISHSDSYSALLWSSFIASIVAVVMTISQRILNLHDVMEAWFKGIQSMLLAALILIFAWTISTVTNDLKTADYLISILSDSIDVRLLPFLVFLICSLVGFSTGTSWGTMAIVMPIVIPLTYKIGLTSTLTPDHLQAIMLGVISAVLAGSVFGDHCSPIADTTILSSLASKCNHIDHVRTQLPYAVVVGISSMALGYLPSAYGLNPFISMFLVFASLIVFLFFFGKKVVAFRAVEEN